MGHKKTEVLTKRQLFVHTAQRLDSANLFFFKKCPYLTFVSPVDSDFPPFFARRTSSVWCHFVSVKHSSQHDDFMCLIRSSGDVFELF